MTNLAQRVDAVPVAPVHALRNDLAARPALSPDLLLKCPCCRTNVRGLRCNMCGFQMKIGNGLIYALPPDRAAHYSRFIADYARIRAAEGRGSKDASFYLALPYKDTTGNNSDQWHIRARSYDYLATHILPRTAPLKGAKILDLGAGNGWMSYRLTLAGYSPAAVDLLDNDQDGLGAADHFRAHVPSMFPRFQAELTCLPFEDEQFDVAIFNASFHYSEDYEATLREAFRCVKVGGTVIVSDSPWYAREESGQRMLMERRAVFAARFGTASDSIQSLEYLTPGRLRALEERLSIRWTIHSPWYGLKWALRPIKAKIRGKREPSRFRIYSAWKTA
jgi:SAM-dependent methyltransferase